MISALFPCADRACAKLSRIATRTYRILTSTIGNALLVAIAEVAGAEFCGTALSRAGKDIGFWTGKHLIPIAGLALSMHQTKLHLKTARVALPLIAAYLTSEYGESFIKMSSEFGSFAGEQTGWIAGMILGGYAARHALGALTCWRTYSTSMLRHTGAGIAFDCMIVQPKGLSALFFILPRQIWKVGVQTVAFSAPDVVPFVKRRFSERTLNTKLVAPLLYQVLYNRFGTQKQVKLQEKLAESAISFTQNSTSRLVSYLPLHISLSMRFLYEHSPYSLNIMGGLQKTIVSIMTPVVQDVLGKTKQNLGDMLQHAPTLILRTLKNYLELLQDKSSICLTKSPDENKRLLKLVLDQSITLNISLDLLFTIGIEKTIDGWAKTLIAKKNSFEKALVGVRLTTKLDDHLETLLPVYLEYYLRYMLQYRNEMKTELSPLEEETLLLEVNQIVLSGLNLSLDDHWILNPLHQFIGAIIQGYYHVAVPTEGIATMRAPIRTISNYSPPQSTQLKPAAIPPLKLGSIHIIENYVQNNS